LAGEGWGEGNGHGKFHHHWRQLAMTVSPVAALRESLRHDRAALEQGFLRDRKRSRLLSAHSSLIDSYLHRVWKHLAMPENIALVAVGGYGRGELYPKSDIDLLILLDAEPDAALQQKLHDLIGMLWDIG